MMHVRLPDLPEIWADDTDPRPTIMEWVKKSRYIPSLSENGSKQNFGRPARLKLSSRLGKVGISSSVAILSRPSGVVSRISVRQEMYTAANRMVSVFEGFFSPGKSGIKSRSLSMCALRVCTRHLSRALAILLCLLTPVKRGPRLLGFFFAWLLQGFAATVDSMAGCCVMSCTHKWSVFNWGVGTVSLNELLIAAFQGLACQLGFHFEETSKRNSFDTVI